MPKLIDMPKIGVNMMDATITEWLVQEGDAVEAGQPVLLAETDKAVQEIPVTESGVIARLLAAEGDTVEVLTPILVLAAVGESYTDADIDAFSAQRHAQKDEVLGSAPRQEPAPPPPVAVKSPAAASRIKITPLARKTALRLGIDFRLVPPSPVTGRIANRDVLAFAEAGRAPEAPAARTGVPASHPMSRTRRLIADRMRESTNTKPHVPLTLTVDAEALLRWRRETKAAGAGINLNTMLVAACARALREFPVLNAQLEGDAIVYQQRVNIGLAVDTENGLLVPKVFDADRMSLPALQADLDRKIERIRGGAVEPGWLSGGTFTVSNLGMYEIEQFAAIINPPETAILAVGAVREAPVIRRGAVTAGSVMTLTMSFDHRVTDGGPAARFLQRVKHLLECPAVIFS